MEWTDEGIVLGIRRHGESSAIAELLTRSHGRHLGLVRGGSSSRLRPLLQPGNSVAVVWRARLDEHLGTYALEGTRMRAATLLASSYAVYGISHLASLARLLPERDPHEDIYEMLERTLDDFDDVGEAAVHLVRFEPRCWPNSASGSIWKIARPERASFAIVPTEADYYPI